MISNTFLYSFFVILISCTIIYHFHNFRPVKNRIDNKVLLKNLLEGLDLDLPDELKTLDSSSSDTQKL